jgi:hypothetical protein
MNKTKAVQWSDLTPKEPAARSLFWLRLTLKEEYEKRAENEMNKTPGTKKAATGISARLY